ncbi:MAG: PHP domain-containing protein [Gammaproteobacteria bacterium]|nr:PHP domain-containing protein [Gammaproteobacteria bacterium]
MSKIDLHTHSTASDGTLAPEELVQLAATAGVTLLALTDHDTLDGLPAARDAAQASGVGFLPGVEISANWGPHSVHIVGLGFDCRSPSLDAFLKNQMLHRQSRAELIADRLARKGIEGALAGAVALAGGRVPGRAHFARYLIAEGQVADFPRAFKRYLGRGCSAYVPPAWPEMAEVIAEIHRAGGAAVLAHPCHYQMSTTWVRHLLEQFRAEQGDGVEVVTSGDDATRIEWLGQQAVANSLAGSIGSDFHAPGQWRHPGKIPGLPRGVESLWSRWDLDKTG